MKNFKMILLILILVFGGTLTALADNSIDVQVTLSENNGQNPLVYYFKLPSDSNYTLLQLMERKFVIEHTNGFITSIQGRAASDSKSTAWLFDINGEMAMVGAGQYRIKAGDSFEWDLRSWK